MLNGVNNTPNYNINSELFTNLNSPDVRITKLFMVVTRDDYVSPFKRSFNVDASYNTINNFKNGVLRTKGFNGELNAFDITNGLNGCVSLQQRPLAMANIVNGWSTKRLRYLMEVVNNVNGSYIISYIQGYTDYFDSVRGLSGNINIDPNMKFYINSILLVRKTYDTALNRYHTVPIAAYNVITNDFGVKELQVDRAFMQDTRLVRPKDIMENLISSNVFSDDVYINTTGHLTSGLQTSKRTNNDPIEYVANTLNGYTTSLNSISTSTDPSDIYRSASMTPFATEASIHSLPFMVRVAGVLGSYDPTWFTLNTLVTIDPNCNNSNVLTLVERDTMDVSNVNSTMNVRMLLDSNTATTLNPTPEAMIASNVNNAIASIMLKNMITRIAVSFGNKSGRYLSIISDVNSFVTDMDLTFYGNRVNSNIENVLLPSLSMNNQLLLEVTVICDILRDTTILVDIGNGPILYRFPTFADSLFVPVIANSATSNDITSGIETLVSAITTDI